MSPLLRHRRATVAVAALFAGAPPLAPGVAAAEPSPPPGVGVQETGREIVFRRSGQRGLRCTSTPETTRVTVPAESTIRVVNRTGRRVRLMVDGVARGELAGGGSAELLFHHGPVALALRPICVFPAESAVRVDVGPVPQGPDAAGPWAAAAPLSAAHGQAPPPGRPGGVAAELTDPVAPVRPEGPIGLLTLIATVCVVGVSAGAIRAILAQRATRTVIA